VQFCKINPAEFSDSTLFARHTSSDIAKTSASRTEQDSDQDKGPSYDGDNKDAKASKKKFLNGRSMNQKNKK
jgi:hypothetical protein